MYNVWLSFIHLVNRLLRVVGLRKQQYYWGVVYDSVTKQPIDPAIVRLIHVDSGRTVETCITDMTGRYGFLTHPGRFKILVKRTNYQFPSTLQTGDRDGIYENLYHGEFFELSGDSEVIALNIPLDPMEADWNQEAKKDVVRRSPYLEHFVDRLTMVMFWYGLVLAAVVYYFYQIEWMLWVLAGYAVVFAAAMVIPPVRLWGLVLSARSKQPVGVVTVELCHPDLQDIVVAKATASEDGKFFLRGNPGKYTLRIRYTSSGGVVMTTSVTVGPEGCVNSNYYV